MKSPCFEITEMRYYSWLFHFCYFGIFWLHDYGFNGLTVGKVTLSVDYIQKDGKSFLETICACAEQILHFSSKSEVGLANAYRFG